MNYNKKTIRDVDVSGKKVLLRVDYNVPMDKISGEIQDDTRIVATLPTIRYLLNHGAAVILCSHMGRPKGMYKRELSLRIVRERLAELLHLRVKMTSDVLGIDTMTKCAALKPGEVLLMENLRFRPEEERNDAGFSRQLASLADIFVFDAFGTAHRAHSSTAGVADYLPAVAGLLMEKELEIMGGALEHPRRPMVVIMGGVKVSDKIGVINNLLDKADTILIGGAMAYTFLYAQGGHIGKSRLDLGKVSYARQMIEKAKQKGVKLLLPVDALAAKEFAPDAQPIPVDSMDIPEDLEGLDIGPKTVTAFTESLQGAGTVIWNGPMGVFEFPAFAEGTNAIARAMAALPDAITIIGGGDSAAAVDKLGLGSRMTHISTGGGASLEFLEGLALPAVSCLLDK